MSLCASSYFSALREFGNTLFKPRSLRVQGFLGGLDAAICTSEMAIFAISPLKVEKIAPEAHCVISFFAVEHSALLKFSTKLVWLSAQRGPFISGRSKCACMYCVFKWISA